MNEKTPKKRLPGNLNKTELNALIDAVINTKFNQKMEDKKRDPKSTKKIKALKAMTSDEAYSMPKKKKRGITTRERMFKSIKSDDLSMPPDRRTDEQKMKDAMDSLLAKGGEVKKYMGGGSVHKKKNKMLTTKGWGASRKT